MKESQILIVMDIENMNKVNIKAEYLTKSSRVYFIKVYDFECPCLFSEHKLKYFMVGIRHTDEVN